MGRSFALTATLFYLLSPTPAVLSSPYTEPTFALMTFSGMFLATKRRIMLASLCLAGATSMRATGVFASGVLGWRVLFHDRIPGRLQVSPRQSRCVSSLIMRSRDSCPGYKHV
jgi:Gpi18-like mannosyltransferase